MRSILWNAMTLTAAVVSMAYVCKAQTAVNQTPLVARIEPTASTDPQPDTSRASSKPATPTPETTVTQEIEALKRRIEQL